MRACQESKIAANWAEIAPHMKAQGIEDGSASTHEIILERRMSPDYEDQHIQPEEKVSQFEPAKLGPTASHRPG